MPNLFPAWSRKRKLLVSFAAGIVLLAVGVGTCVKRPLPPEEQVRVLVQQLRQPDTLGNRMHHAVWKTLPTALSEKLFAVSPISPQRLQAEALAELKHLAPKSEQAVSALIGALSDPSLAVNAVEALGAIGPFAYAALPKLLSIAEVSASGAVYTALSSIGPKDERVLALIFAKIKANGPEAWLVYPSLERCAPHYDEAVRRRLLAVFQENRTNHALIRVIGKIAPESEDTISFLLGLLRDGDLRSRATVAALLNEQPRNRAEFVPELARLLTETLNEPGMENELRRMRHRILEALARSTPGPFVDTLGLGSLNISHNAIGALAKMGPAAASAVPLLQECTQRLTGYLRFESALAIYRIAGDFAVCENVFAQGLSASEESTRRLAIKHLVTVSEDPVSFPLLRSALANPDRKVRDFAAVAMGNLGSRAVEALPDLEALYTDATFAVRIEATNAVRRIRQASMNSK